jgi:hypothetical protein
MSKGTGEIHRTDNIAETTEIFGYPTDNRLFEMFNLIEFSPNLSKFYIKAS